MFKTGISIIIFLAFVFAAMQLQAGITGTKHNLSVSGLGTIKATTETQICVFCHTPHAASTVDLGGGWRGPLWNHSLSAANYTISDPEYSRQEGAGLQLSTPLTTGSRVDGGTKLCLSCHDGTVAIGALYNAPGAGGIGGSVAMTTTYMPGIPGDAGSPNLGTNIRGTHLVSIAYNGNVAGTLVYDKNRQCAGSFGLRDADDSAWATSKIKLRNTAAQYKGANGINHNSTFSRTNLCTTCGIQCSTCHDAHGVSCSNPGVGKCSSNSTYEKFIVVDYSNSDNLCGFCHISINKSALYGCP